MAHVHNGVISGLHELRRELVLAVDLSRLAEIRGSTDSEVLFHLTLFGSVDASAIRALYPELERLQALRDDDRVIVSEPLADLHGVWDEIPDGSALVVQPGRDEQRPFRPSAPRTAVAV